jgi:hypothetical protein
MQVQDTEVVRGSSRGFTRNALVPQWSPGLGAPSAHGSRFHEYWNAHQLQATRAMGCLPEKPLSAAGPSDSASSDLARVVGLESECLTKVIPLGERHLRWAVREHAEHYHLRRNHQGLANELIERCSEDLRGAGPVESGWGACSTTTVWRRRHQLSFGTLRGAVEPLGVAPPRGPPQGIDITLVLELPAKTQPITPIPRPSAVRPPRRADRAAVPGRSCLDLSAARAVGVVLSRERVSAVCRRSPNRPGDCCWARRR